MTMLRIPSPTFTATPLPELAHPCMRFFRRVGELIACAGAAKVGRPPHRIFSFAMQQRSREISVDRP